LLFASGIGFSSTPMKPKFRRFPQKEPPVLYVSEEGRNDRLE
jgi:hypothetical protein